MSLSDTRWLATMVAGLALPAAVPAQDARIEQIPAAPPPADVPAARRDVLPPPQLAPAARAPAPAQLSRAADARTPVTQLNREPRSARSAPRVSDGKRSVQAAAPLSSRGESKPGGVVRVGGRDRCDPGASGARPADCARVIETRSGEFARPNPLTLSAEQRLMVDQRLRDLPATAVGAVARIGRNEVDADATDAQSVAAVVLPGQPAEAPPTAATPVQPVPGDAEVLDIIQALTGGTPVVTGPPR